MQFALKILCSGYRCTTHTFSTTVNAIWLNGLRLTFFRRLYVHCCVNVSRWCDLSWSKQAASSISLWNLCTEFWMCSEKIGKSVFPVGNVFDGEWSLLNPYDWIAFYELFVEHRAWAAAECVCDWRCINRTIEWFITIENVWSIVWCVCACACCNSEQF